MASQLAGNLRSAIRAGLLHPHTRLPASRDLARQLGVSRGVVVSAYGLLVEEGYLIARQGSGTVVAGGVSPVHHEERSLRPATWGVRYDLRPTVPDVLSFPRADWRRSYGEGLSDLDGDLLAHPPRQGAEALRSELARYLGRVRGVATTPSQIVVFNGFWQGLDVLCRALRKRGVRSVAVEDPCFGYHRRIIARSGLRSVGIAVDRHGLQVEHLTSAAIEAVLVSPAHQYPTGAVLSAERRRELIGWAKANDALIIEDDYDAEHRYDREPVGCLQGLAPEHVIYGGTLSKTLSSALRLGWLAVPRWLAEDVSNEKAWADMGTAVPEQLSLARFLSSGRFSRHLRRLRPVYRRRRDLLLAALAEDIPEARPVGAAAGLHVMTYLPSHVDEAELLARARQAGLLVEGAAEHHAGPDAPAALILGYGNLPEPSIEPAVRVLATALARAGH